jgi:N6-adenosine-specific RNA methylase IME4
VDTTYKTVTADCPWETPGGGRIGLNAQGRPADQQFASMEVGELINLARNVHAQTKVLTIAGHSIAEDAHLYLWMVQGHEEDAFRVARAWQFRPICINPWVKRRTDIDMHPVTRSAVIPPLQIGSGRYFRRAHENYLFCVRGSLMTANGAREPSVHEAPRPPKGTWGSKPPSFYELVERQSPGPYLELFSRNTRDGWTMWGNEVGKRGHVAVIPRIAREEASRRDPQTRD